MFLKENCENDLISLNKVDLNSIELEEQTDKDFSVIFCNLVTTSIFPEEGDILRINLKLCYLNTAGKFTKIRKTVSFFQDPKRELLDNESKYLDFSIDDVEGKSIDWKLVSSLFDQADLIVSHNSRFTKPWLKKYIGEKSDIWSCTLEKINWKEMGSPSRSLETISVFSGHFYNFSDTVESLDSLLLTLHKNNCLESFIREAFLPDIHLYAANAPIEYKDDLKARKYMWNPELKCWWKPMDSKEDSENETLWLNENVPSVEPQIFEIDSKFRFA